MRKTTVWMTMVVVAGTAAAASAGQMAVLKASNKYQARASWSAGRNGQNFRANGSVFTEFRVHPPRTVVHNFQKNPGDFGNGVYLPLSNWDDQETDIHGTVATVSHDLSGALRVLPPLAAWFSVRDDCSASIQPGIANERPVSVRVRGRDPWSFGLLDDGALFEPNPDGFDNLLTLAAGTGFATTDGMMDFGGSVLEFGTRVAPGVVDDPDAFWSDMTPGAIDLYSLTLTVDPTMQVHADLMFGASTPDFALEFYDGTGTAFDPTDFAQVGVIEQQIESAFIDGVLTTDLTDLLNVSFIPDASMGAYTAGQTSAAEAAGIETPAPGTGLCLVGALGLLSTRRRRGLT